MSKKIMILGASILQLPAIQKAKEMGLEVVAVDIDPKAIGFNVSGINSEVISTIDIPAVLMAAKRNKIDGIMTLASDMPMRTIAVVAKECGLVGISADTALKATNKVVMREALMEYGVPIPEFHKATTKEQYDEAVESFLKRGIKFIVKPADNSGSRGVYLVDEQDTKTAKEVAYQHSKQFSRSGDIIIEEYMEGPEVSVETLSIDGECHVIQITDKLTTGAPYFVEMGHSQPTQLPSSVADEIKRVAKMAVKAIGVVNGPSHTEIKATPTGAKVVELGARLGGDCITTHLVPLSTGVDMVECCIKIALGEKVEVIPKIHMGSAIRYFFQEAGTIKSIDGLDDATQTPGVKQVSIIHGVGEQITDIESSSSRMGFVITQGNNAGDASVICEKARAQIKIEIG